MLLAFLLAATLVGPADVESLAAAADAVVYGQVVRRSSAWAPGGGQIFTTVVLRPIETWKGASAGEVSILVPGGELGELSQTVQGAAAFSDAEEVVVFLHRRAPGTYGVERLALGKFVVGAPAGSLKRAHRDRRGLTCLRCDPAESDDLPLEELRARVLGSVQR
ncbi:MAG: hypothetical protein E6J66_00340 [Deltaproteobacteria bacterium]|nr:MAG: hypothetical protein E6J66_00340 [Deltaproteobacteria bacterium]